MRTTVVGIALALSVRAASAGEALPAGRQAAFTSEPTVTRDGEAVRIAFAVSAATDVEVAVLNAKGAVVRHLAAGVLGPKASVPLHKDALAQEIVWDRTDDLGQPVREACTVRVRIGSQPRLDTYAGWDRQTIGGGIFALAVGPGGEVFVFDSPGWGHCNARVFGPDGTYRRTIMPYAAATPAERTAAAGHVMVGAERVPMVFNGQGGNVMPLTHGMRDQTVAVSPKGHLLLASAVGTMAEHGPPRHLLALDPKGGAPEGVGFVGPEIRKPLGFLGGAGEGGARYFDHLATSPDGEWIYFVPCKLGDKKPRHAVFRLGWTDTALGKPFLGTDGEPGADETHLNDPQGVAVDGDGRLYVCDRGNNRVVRFAPDGTFQSAFPVDSPQQIAIHRKTGGIVILSRAPDEKQPGRWGAASVLHLFERWGAGALRETARLEGRPIELIALDPEAEPLKVWAVIAAGWSRQEVLSLTLTGAAFAAGQPINRYDGLRFPMFIAADPPRGRILIREMYTGRKGLMALDLKTNRIERLKGPGGGLIGASVTLDREGNIYTMDGYGQNSLSRYTPDGTPLPFSGVGSHTIKTGVYRGYGPDMGMRGHCVGLNGDIYLIRSSNYGGPGEYGGRVDCFGPDGKPKKRNLIDGLGYGDCGLGVDAAGNVYVGANVKPKDRPFPDDFMGKVSAEPFAWWRRGRREVPWHYMYLNPYLFYWGSVFKFGPAGGAFYGHPFGRETAEPIPDVFYADRAPAGALSLASPYLSREIKVAGALWRYAGTGVIPSSSDGPLPDPGCVCMPSQLAVDPYGRVYAPDVFRFSIEMLDTNGTLVHRIGRYGNVDDKDPEIALAWPAFVSVADGKVYIADSGNARVAVVRFDYAAEARRPVP